MGGLGYWGWLGVHEVPQGSIGVQILAGRVIGREESGRHWFPYRPLGEIVYVPSSPMRISIPDNWFIVSKEGIPIKAKFTLSCSITDPLLFVEKGLSSTSKFLIRIEGKLLKTFASLPFKKIAGNTQIAVNILKFEGADCKIIKSNLHIPSEIKDQLAALNKLKLENERYIENIKKSVEEVTGEAEIYAEKITREAYLKFKKSQEDLQKIRTEYDALKDAYSKDPSRIEKLIK